MIQNILTPLGSKNVLTPNVFYGRQLAKHLNIKLRILQTYPIDRAAYAHGGMVGGVAGPSIEPPLVDPLAFDVAATKKKLAGMLKKEFPEIQESAYEILVLPGPTGAILSDHRKSDEGQELRSDLIVVNADIEISDFETIIAQAPEVLSRKAPGSTLIVPRNYAYKPFERITLALDEENAKEEIPVDNLVHILEGYNANLDAMHVQGGSAELVNKARDLINNSLKATLSTSKISDFNLHTITEDEMKRNNVKNDIEIFTNDQCSDLLALIYREHGIFKRLFAPGIRKQLIRELTIPLLILK